MVAFHYQEQDEGPSSDEFTTTILEEIRTEARRLQAEYGYPLDKASFMAAAAAMAPCIGVLLGSTHQPVTTEAITAHVVRLLGTFPIGDLDDGTC